MHDNYDDDDNMYGGMWFLKCLWFKIRLIEYWLQRISKLFKKLLFFFSMYIQTEAMGGKLILFQFSKRVACCICIS